MIDKVKLGEQIKTCRKNRNMTQKQLAAKTDTLTTNWISQFETGSRLPSLDALFQLVRAFGFIGEAVNFVDAAVIKEVDRQGE